MRWQTTAALAVILLAVGIFYYVYEIRMAPDREKVEARKGRLFEAEPPEATELKIERGGDVVHAKREGDAWQLLSPVKARADKGAVEEVLTSTLTVRADREVNVAPTPTQLPEFGLDKPVARLTVVLKDGKQLGLVLGAKSPTGTWVFAREPDKPAIMTVGDSLLRDATRPAADFRDKSVLAFDRAAVTGVDVTTRDETIGFQTADNAWSITKPVALKADADVVRDFLDKLGAAKVKEFVAESPPSTAPFGLDQPVRVSVHTGKDKERATRTLLLGRLDAEKKGVYAMREGEPSVLLVPEDVWNAVPRTVATARDRTVIDFTRDKVARVEVESPKGAVQVAKDGDKWRITAPEQLAADQVEVGAVLFKLRELKAQGFLAEDAAGIARFLATPTVKVSVVEEGAKEPKTLLLAPSPERRGGQPSAYAAVAGKGPVVLVDAKALDELAKSVMDLRDRSFFAGLEPKDLRRVRVKSGDKTVMLERAGDAEWKVVEPQKGSAKSAKVEDLIYVLRALRWKDVAEPAGKEPARFGLDAPSLEVSLYRTDGTEVGTIQVGKREADRAFVKLRNAPAIYTVDPKQLGEPIKVPDDLAGQS